MKQGFCVSGDEAGTEQSYILVFGVSDKSSLTGPRPEHSIQSLTQVFPVLQTAAVDSKCPPLVLQAHANTNANANGESIHLHVQLNTLSNFDPMLGLWIHHMIPLC